MDKSQSNDNDDEFVDDGSYADVSKNEMRIALTKIIEDKQVFLYKKLVVPISMRSIYWKYFGFPASEDGNILTKLKIVCILCKTQIAYNRNTSNLRMHLQNKHAQELAVLELRRPKKPEPKTPKKKFKKNEKTNGKSNNFHIYATDIDGIVQINNELQFVTDGNNLSSHDIVADEDDDEDGYNQQQQLQQQQQQQSQSGKNVKTEALATSSVAAALEAATAAINSKSDNQISMILASDDNSIQMKSISDAITEFLIIDLQLPEIVEGRGFQRLIATLKLPCEIPSKNTLENQIIPRIYNTFRESIAHSLEYLNSEYSLIFEEWKSINNEHFTTISICYQNSPDSNLEMKVLNTVHTPIDWDQNQYGSLIDNILLEWNLDTEKIVAFVIASDRNVLLNTIYNRNYLSIPCLLYLLQKCAETCFNNPVIAEILNKCRAIIGVRTANNLYLEDLLSQENSNDMDDEMEDNVLVLDHPSIWSTTYNMIEQIVAKKSLIESMISSINGMDQYNIDLTSGQWNVLEELVTLLSPFKVTLITLSEEKMPLLSLLKPLLWQLISSHLKYKDDDSDLIKLLKKQVSDFLTERFEDPNINLLLNITTFLDPRFKQLPYISAEEKKETTAAIKEKLKKLILAEQIPEVNIKTENAPSSVKKNRLSGMELLLGSVCTPKSTIPVDEKAELEIIQYQTEPVPPLNHCPGQWWDKMSAKCPYLSKAFKCYNCVPLCSIPPSRIPSEAQIIFNNRRSALPPHISDKLLFLHGNH